MKSTDYFQTGFKADFDVFETRPKVLLWSRNLAKHPGLHQGEQTIVLGHTPVQALHLGSKPRWLSQGKLVLMDTGSFLGNGHISCVNLLTKEVWQSD